MSGEFSPQGVVVGLARLKTEVQRRDQIGRMNPRMLSAKPFSDLPRFMRLLDEEAVAVGLQPLGSKE